MNGPSSHFSSLQSCLPYLSKTLRWYSVPTEESVISFVVDFFPCTVMWLPPMVLTPDFQQHQVLNWAGPIISCYCCIRVNFLQYTFFLLLLFSYELHLDCSFHSQSPVPSSPSTHLSVCPQKRSSLPGTSTKYGIICYNKRLK